MFDRFQYISQGKDADTQLYNINAALDAGCRWVQLRFKSATDPEMLRTAEQARKLCADAKAILIINDHVLAAKAVSADGVHLGLTDTPVATARKILGTKAIIGGTANTAEQVLQRQAEQCSYIGLGPFRFTATKEKLSPVLGIEGYRNIMQQLPKGFPVPVYGIGGILLDDIPAIRETGLYGIAASGLLTEAKAKSALIQKINEALCKS